MNCKLYINAKEMFMVYFTQKCTLTLSTLEQQNALITGRTRKLITRVFLRVSVNHMHVLMFKV
jgi:hypothetical protein